MNVNNDYSAQLNRLYLPITGFFSEIRLPNQHILFRDMSSFEFIVETLIAHSASEIIVQSYGDKYDNRQLSHLPQILRCRIKFVDQGGKSVELAKSIFYPVFDEFSIEPNRGLALKIAHKKSPEEDELFSAITHSYWEIHTFLLGLKHKSQIDINMESLKSKLCTIREQSKNPASRANISVLEGILNCYSLHKIDGLSAIPNYSKETLNAFLEFLEGSNFKRLSKENFQLGFPDHIKNSAIKIRQRVRRILCDDRFQKILYLSSKSITAATSIPLPAAEIATALLTSKYLPPIISIKPLLDQAELSWKTAIVEEDLLERYERSTGREI